MRMHRFFAWIAVCLLMVSLCAMPVGAVEESASNSMKTTNKVYSMVMAETSGVITATPETPAFWEYPLLRAGEKFLTEGTMVVRNDGQKTASMVLEPVPIPYGDDAKLTYLDSILLTVTEGDTVLFHNTYAHINDVDGGLSLIYNDMAPGEEHTYTIRMECLFTYPGDVYQDAVPMSWRFSAKAETVTIEEEEKPIASWLWIVLVTLVVIILAMVVIMIVQAIMRAKAAKPKAVEKAQAESVVTEQAPQSEDAIEEFVQTEAETAEPSTENEETAKKEEETVDNGEEV